MVWTIKSNRGRAGTILSNVYYKVPQVHYGATWVCKVQLCWNPRSPQGYKGLLATAFVFWWLFDVFLFLWGLQSLVAAIADDGRSFAIDLQGLLTASSWKVCLTAIPLQQRTLRKQESGQDIGTLKLFLFFKKQSFTVFCTVLSIALIKVLLLINKINLF